MDKGTRTGIIVFICVILFMVAICICCFYIGRVTVKSADNGDSQRIAEYGRQMGLAAEAIRTIDSGLGDVSKDLASVANAAGRDATNLREIAQRLLTIANDVKTLEDRVNGLRDITGSLIDNLNNSTMGEEIGEP